MKNIGTFKVQNDLPRRQDVIWPGLQGVQTYYDPAISGLQATNVQDAIDYIVQNSLTGPQGYSGFQGNQGNAGVQGNLGFQGNQGEVGFQGSQGNQGEVGFHGYQGAQGNIGIGNQGPQGEAINGITFSVDGGGVVLPTGIVGEFEVPYAATINRSTLLCFPTGGIQFDIWKSTYAGAMPTVANTIVASAPPTITNDVKSQDTTLSGWTTSIAAGDILRYNINSISGVQRVSLTLKVTK